MNTIFEKVIPYLLILIGFLLLLYINMPIPAGIFFLLGIVMIIEAIWPEKWGTDEHN